MANEPALYARMELRIRDFERQLQKAQSAADASMAKISRSSERATKAVESRFAAMGKGAGSSLASFGRTAAAGLLASLGAREIGQAAAAYVNLQNTLKVAGLEGQALTGTFQQLFEIAQRNGTAIEPLVTLYSRLSQSQTELGASSDDLIKFTDGISLALRVGGTNAEAASGALLQLSQALGSSVVRAEEFNSINEGARPILQAVANGLEEAGGSVSKLRTLVLAGSVSNKTFFDAFNAGTGGLAVQAAKAAGTTDQAVSRINNAFVLLIGKLDETTGASRNAAGNLDGVASAIEKMPGLIDRAVAGFKSLRDYLSEVGNMPVWRKLGEFLGGDYSPEGLAKVGITYVPPGSEKKSAGSSRRGGATMAQTGIETVSIKDAPVDDEKATKERINSYERLTAAITERTGAIQAETEAQAGLNPLVNDYGFAVEKARAEYDLLQAAHEAGLTVTPQLEAQIEALATSYADASVAAAHLAEAQGKVQESAAEFNDIGRDVLGGFISDIQRGVSAAAALEGALAKVADKLLDIALNSIFPSSGGGGIGAAIASAFGGSVSGSGGIGHAATGGRIRGPGSGTSDSVPMMLSNGEYVVRASQAKKHAALLEAINSGTVGMMAAGGFVAPTLPRMPARSGGGSVGGAAPQLNLQIINQSDAKVTTSQPTRRADGGFDQKVLIRMMEDVVVNQMTDGSRGSQVLKRQWGLRRSDLA
ncbi:tape measure domain-containing protein [Ancylobacter aquaticus]|uniref:Tape measure domain-containing protein n=1 Tax=Ancylobacter aquaticus TaxID=100 RepID=A0A4R1I891_ANCAQ|nr:tape measure protein [Ancylobacter aquaticus]TCK31238.1 tape measure domain-containing protein [Ancylobacter aquaticus]